MKKPKDACAAVVILCFAALWGCSNDRVVDPEPERDPPALVMAPDAATLTVPGEQRRYSAKLWLGDEAVPRERTRLDFASRNESVATVNLAGVVTARGNGRTWIVVESNGAADSVEITVRFQEQTDEPPARFTVAFALYSERDIREFNAGIQEALDTLNARFNRPGVFRHSYEILLDTAFTFQTDNLDSLIRAPRRAHYLVLYDMRRPARAGCCGAFRTITMFGQLGKLGTGYFTSDATDILVHEFGHARGADDMYYIAVRTNHVSGDLRQQPKGTMWANGEGWDGVSQGIINERQRDYPTWVGWTASEWPPAMEVRVVERDDKPVEGATVRLYPVGDAASVLETAILSARTDADGRVSFLANPFGDRILGDIPVMRACAVLGCRYLLLLAEISAAGQPLTYAWLAVDEVQRLYWQAPSKPYVRTVTLGAPTL